MTTHGGDQDYEADGRDPVPQWLYKDLIGIRQDISELKARLWPLQMAVYGLVAIVMSGVIVGIVSLVVKTGHG